MTRGASVISDGSVAGLRRSSLTALRRAYRTVPRTFRVRSGRSISPAIYQPLPLRRLASLGPAGVGLVFVIKEKEVFISYTRPVFLTVSHDIARASFGLDKRVGLEYSFFSDVTANLNSYHHARIQCFLATYNRFKVRVNVPMRDDANLDELNFFLLRVTI